MKRINTWKLAAGMTAGLAAACTTNATLITTAAPLTPTAVVDFQQFTSVAFASATPLQVGTSIGQDIELFGIGTFDTYVGPVSHSLGSNGQWNSATDTSIFSVRLPVSSSLAFEFVFNDGPVQGVGGFMNYAPGYGPVTIEAFDSVGTLLESHEISTVAPISTPGALNEGAFRGILRTSADISTFRVSGGYAVLDDLTFIGVPEPASFALLAIGGLATIRRRTQ